MPSPVYNASVVRYHLRPGPKNKIEVCRCIGECQYMPMQIGSALKVGAKAPLGPRTRRGTKRRSKPKSAPPARAPARAAPEKKKRKKRREMFRWDGDGHIVCDPELVAKLPAFFTVSYDDSYSVPVPDGGKVYYVGEVEDVEWQNRILDAAELKTFRAVLPHEPDETPWSNAALPHDRHGVRVSGNHA